MSDPVTTAEVEDVLSSIRRLVSEEKRPVQQAETLPQTGRLVLTPALRVQDDKPLKEEGNADIHAAFRAEQAEGAVSPLADVYDDADSATTLPEDIVADHDIAPERPGTLNLTSADLADDYSNDPYNFNDSITEDVGKAAVALPPLTLQPETRRDADWAADALAEAEAVAEQVKVGEDSAEQTAQKAVEEVVAKETSVTATKAATLSAKIEALESAIGGMEGDFEPDEVSDDAYSGTHAPALAWEDDIEDVDLDGVASAAVEEVFATDLAHDASYDATYDAPDDLSAEAQEMSADVAKDITDDTVRELHKPIHEAVFAAAAAELDSAEDDSVELTSETKLLDEDALRDMVGEIVRLELQGALGERITRNVRKLVRREIHRALTTQELD